MMVTLFLCALTIASVAYAIQVTVLFEGFRWWVLRTLGTPTQKPRDGVFVTEWVGKGQIRQWVLQGVQCPYCFSHWIGLVVVPLMAESWREAAMLLLPAIWVANHVAAFYGIVLQIGPLMTAKTQALQSASRQHGMERVA